MLRLRGADLRDRPLTERRALLEDLAAGLPTGHVITISLLTDQRAEAELWLQVLPRHGIEGLVIKAKGQRYLPGLRAWLEINSVGEARAGALGWSCLRSSPACLISGSECDRCGARDWWDCVLMAIWRRWWAVTSGDGGRWPARLPVGFNPYRTCRTRTRTARSYDSARTLKPPR